MPGFKDLVKQDVKNVFINFEEFGERHNVDGSDVIVVVDDNELIEREKGRAGNSYIDGIYKKRLMFYIAAEDIDALPQVGRVMTFDREDYIVTDAVSECGIFSISLEVYEH